VSRRGLAVVVFLLFAALVAVCLVVGDNGWDDGAITLAFARTFAGHGRVALMPHSEAVEGFSSVSWFLLNAAAALVRPSYHAAILVSQVLSALCICACTALLARTCALLRLDRLFSALVVITFAAWGCSFAEAANGMEMGLLTLALLLMVNELLSPQPRPSLLATGAALALTTRFEAIAYVAPLALSVASLPGRRAFRAIAVAGLGAVLLLTVWRWAAFRDFLPNTFWAKRWPPYAAFGLADRLAGAVELPMFFLVPLVGLAVARARGFDVMALLRPRRLPLSILAAPILGAVVMGALIGRHWGYLGRMPYFAFPFMLVLQALVFAGWVAAKAGTLRRAVAVGTFVACGGVSMIAFPSGALGAALHGGSFGVTPHTYAESGQIFRRVAAAADAPGLAILTPDVGGLALCCEEMRIVDLGLLSNRRLAHQGPAALAEVLETESPDIVEAHWEWASTGKLYDLPYFRSHYLPAFAGRTKFWLRRDVAQAIESKGRGCWLAANREDVRDALRAHRYADHDTPDDRASFERGGRLFALKQGPTTATLCAAGAGDPPI